MTEWVDKKYRRCAKCSQVNMIYIRQANRQEDWPGGIPKDWTEYELWSCLTLGCEATMKRKRDGSKSEDPMYSFVDPELKED